MPVGPFETFDACVNAMLLEDYDSVTSRKICGALESANQNRKNLSKIINNSKPGRQLRHNAMTFKLNEIKESDFMISIPVVLTTEGVMNGGHKRKEDLAQSFWTFDGIPVTFSHPPFGVVTQLNECKGWVSDINYDPETGDISGMCNILKRTDTKDAIKSVRSKKYNEVSIGYWSTDIEKDGIYNDAKRTKKNYPYSWIETELVGNHLAIMMDGEKGACSPEMGCSLGNSELPPNEPGDWKREKGYWYSNDGKYSSYRYDDGRELDYPVLELPNNGDIPMVNENETPTPKPVENEQDPTPAPAPVPDPAPAAPVVETPTPEVGVDSQSVEKLSNEMNEMKVELKLLREYREKNEKEPLLNELVEVTGMKREDFEKCTVESLTRQLVLAKNITATRNGLEPNSENDTNGGLDNTVEAFEYDEQENKMKFVEITEPEKTVF